MSIVQNQNAKNAKNAKNEKNEKNEKNNETKSQTDNRAFTAHMQMTVQSAMGLTNKQLVDWFGGPASEVRAYLKKVRSEGRIYLHTEGCDNEDPVTGKCLRHY